MSSGITDTARGTAVVTGAARGLGQHFAVALAEAGHDVAILDLDDASATRELIETTGRRCLTVCGDASDPQDVHSFVAAVRNGLSPARVVCSVSEPCPTRGNEASVVIWLLQMDQ